MRFSSQSITVMELSVFVGKMAALFVTVSVMATSTSSTGSVGADASRSPTSVTNCPEWCTGCETDQVNCNIDNFGDGTPNMFTLPKEKTKLVIEGNFTGRLLGFFKNVPHVKTLTLLGNFKISSLQNGFFRGLTDVTKLVISNIEAQSIERRAFGGLNSLITLRFEYLYITQLLGFTFTGLSRLTSLKFDRARDLKQIDKDAFRGLFSLVNLTLRGLDSLTTLESTTFSPLSKLSKLEISVNVGDRLFNLQYGLFSDLKSLTTLDLRSDKIFASNVTIWHFGNFDTLQRSPNSSLAVLVPDDVPADKCSKWELFRVTNFSRLDGISIPEDMHCNHDEPPPVLLDFQRVKRGEKFMVACHSSNRKYTLSRNGTGLGKPEYEDVLNVIGNTTYSCGGKPGIVQVVQSCVNISALKDGYFSPGSYEVNSTRNVTCREGFYLSGKSIVTCLPNGEWGDLQSSLPKCVKAGAADNHGGFSFIILGVVFITKYAMKVIFSI